MLCLGLAAAAVSAEDEGLWSVGLRGNGFWDFEPGNDYFFGPEIGYSNYDLFAHRLQFKAAYLTNRLEQVFRPNILKQDYFLFTPVWHFRRDSMFDPTFQVDLGYARYDIEYKIFSALENSTWVITPQLGFNLTLGQGQYGFFYHFGYNYATSQSSMVYPGAFGAGFWMLL